MKFPRRNFLRLAAGAAALPALSRATRAQVYPSRPVRIIVFVGAGGTPDIIGRLIAQWLSERLQQQFFIDNRPGAGGNVGTEAVVKAAPDGYTLLLSTTPNAINATLYNNLKFNFVRDIAPVAGLVRLPNVMVVNPSVPAKTLPEFIDYAKANPGKINMASGGIGFSGHLAGEMLKAMTGINMVHVPYRTSFLPDLLAGRVQVSFPNLPPVIEDIGSGKLRALAVTTAARFELLSDIPAMGEFVQGYEASAWSGIGAPKDTPSEIASKLNKEINAALASPMIKARFADLGGTPLPGSPTEFGKLIADETEKWGKVIRAAGIKAL
jgi:tripartite-type tricarboxylate transporter receptor subunit TctC